MSIDLSLDRLQQLLPHLPYTRPTLHIAGTNGKGSVSALLTSVLASSQLRVGRFNSPHLVSILDSITINNTPITQQLYDTIRDGVAKADATQGTKLTSFELLTMTALQVFEDQQVDIVVLEVGMGGRLDATNVIPSSCVLVSCLTAVDLDHQSFLGDTVSLIAKEKSGIARKGRAFVLGRQAHGEVEGVVKEVVNGVGGFVIPAIKVQLKEDVAKKEGWTLLREGMEIGNLGPPFYVVKFRLNPFGDVDIEARFPLRGAHQLDNLGTALGVIDALLSSASSSVDSLTGFFGLAPEVSAGVDKLDLKRRLTKDAIVLGIENVKWAGRLSFHTLSVAVDGETEVELLVLVDGAHNPASAKTLGAYVTELLDLTHTASSLTSEDQKQTEQEILPITYILSLSHSPPKTPLQTLAPILPPSASFSSSSELNVDVGVALLPFSAPDGMPWIRGVPMDVMRETVCALMPNLTGDSNASIWVAPSSSSSREGEPLKDLKEVFKWVARRHVLHANTHAKESSRTIKKRAKGLVVLAGSLYLVADFYRLMALEEGVEW